MSSETVDMLNIRTAKLLESIVEDHNPSYGFGTMTCSVYDTAWVSMIKTPGEASPAWLSPQSFQYLLDSQQASGGWSPDVPEMDSILNALAGLLALRQHAKAKRPSENNRTPDLIMRIYKAAAFLQERLQYWDVESTIHVGFETLAPALLNLLEGEGLLFDFPGRVPLMKIRETKMARFRSEMLYEDKKIAAIHCLEALVGQINFDRLSHHKINGSMMASPSSTAAYLIYSSNWDQESEAYIRHVISHGPGKGDGSVPSAFPSSLFEISWVITSLATAGFDVSALSGKYLTAIQLLLQEAFDNGAGLIGFTPGVCSDADDTAKGIMAMQAHGISICPDQMIKEYEQPQCFKTYASERNPSFSTNCNVLITLLHAAEPVKYEQQIQKIARYLCEQWRQVTGFLIDKWNISPYYPLMLMSQALMGALVHWDDKQSSLPPETHLKEEVTQTLWQALIRTLQTQNQNGSWGQPSSREATAYAITATNVLASLPTSEPVRTRTQIVLDRGRAFLMQTVEDELEAEKLWIEKVTYGSRTLSEAYVLGALKRSPSTHTFTDLADLQNGISNISALTKTYMRMPSLVTKPEWLVQAWQIEASLYTLWLKRNIPEVFPGMSQRGKKYIDFIPFTWVVGNNMTQPPPLSSEVISAMMMLSLLIYQVDEFMQSVVESQPRAHLGDIRNSIQAIFTALNDEPICLQPLLHHQVNEHSTRTEDSRNISETLSGFVKWVLHHPLLSHASASSTRHLRTNLHHFLLAHLTHLPDSHQLHSSQYATPTPSQPPSSSSFFTWAHSTSTNHTGGPFALSFLLALLDRPHHRQLPSLVADFTAEDVNRHSATLCRIYNDLGSVARDRDEGNLNSVDFLDAGRSRAELQEELLEVAGYERGCLGAALEALKGECEERTWRAVRCLVDVTDLYGQMDMLKDLTPRVGRHGGMGRGE